MYCANSVIDWKSFRAKYNETYWQTFNEQETHETLYIRTRYVCLFTRPEERVPLERVQAVHDQLNTAFGGRNLTDLSKVPSTPNAPFQQVIGNPNIQFLPLQSRALTVEYLPVTSPLDAVSPAEHAGKLAGVHEGVLNIYIGQCARGSVLGQAPIEGNQVYILHSTVGGPRQLGTLAGYNQGKTLVHEVGHALGCRHLFQDNVCDGYSVYTDLPEQIRPNTNVTLYELSPGVWDMKNDNRDIDRQHNTNYSCAHLMPLVQNEAGVNFMDYDDDEHSLFFSRNQADTMRARLLHSSNQNLILVPTIEVQKQIQPVDATDTLALATWITLCLWLILGAWIFLVWILRRRRQETNHSNQTQSYPPISQT